MVFPSRYPLLRFGGLSQALCGPEVLPVLLDSHICYLPWGEEAVRMKHFCMTALVIFLKDLFIFIFCVWVFVPACLFTRKCSTCGDQKRASDPLEWVTKVASYLSVGTQTGVLWQTARALNFGSFSLCSPGCPGIHSVEQNWPWTHRDLSASVFQVPSQTGQLLHYFI